jgi:ABC-type lipoprotein release transport system permease subunit
MPLLVRMAWRNLGRNRIRTLLTAGAMTAAVALLLFTVALTNGMYDDMIVSATRQYTGHIVVGARGYRDDFDQNRNLDAADPELGRLATDPAVRGSSPRLRVFGLLAFGDETAAAEFLGVEPARERSVTLLQEHLVAGRYLAASAGQGAVVGRGLAERLGAKVGDRIVFLSQAADGSIANDLLTVEGVFATGDFGHDNGLALVSLPVLQELMLMEGRVHELALVVAAPGRAPEEAARLAGLLPPGGEYEVFPWQTLIPPLAEAIRLYDASIWIMVAVLYLAAASVFINTVGMNFHERRREFAVMLAVGSPPGLIRGLIAAEALLMGILAVAGGSLLGWASSVWLARVGLDLSGSFSPISYGWATIMPVFHGFLTARNYLDAAGAMLAMSFLASLPTARRAARVRPAAAIQGREG